MSCGTSETLDRHLFIASKLAGVPDRGHEATQTPPKRRGRRFFCHLHTYKGLSTGLVWLKVVVPSVSLGTVDLLQIPNLFAQSALRESGGGSSGCTHNEKDVASSWRLAKYNNFERCISGRESSRTVIILSTTKADKYCKTS